jgi:membrane protease YdiL (CAAX protease family)
MNSSPAILAEHALTLFLIVGLPLWDLYEIPRLKASTDPAKKLRYYRKIGMVLWLLAGLACLLVGFGPLFRISYAPAELAWMAEGSRGRSVLLGVFVGAIAAIVMPAVIAIWSEKLRVKAAKAAQRLSFLLPSSRDERQWWIGVCVTAGVCEEIVYRGFLLHYFHASPLHLSLTWALVVSSIVFGIAHLYQGVSGAVGTAVVGFVLGAVFLMTGSLMVPMVMHAVLDLRILLMLPGGFAASER